MPNDTTIKDLLSYPAKVVSKMIVKYEAGKNRAIYSVDMLYFYMCELIFNKCEQRLPTTFPVGTRANDKYVKNRILKMKNKGYVAAIDYEDFNSQHSFSNMIQVMLAYYEVYFNRTEESDKVFE